MSDSQVTVGPKDDRPFLGHAVENGRIRFSSVSQIVMYDVRQEGGCPSRWYYQYVLGKKEEKTEAQLAGNKFALSQAHYLKTGADVLEPELRALKHFLPKPGPDLRVEEDMASDIVGAVRLREALFKPENQSGREAIVREMRRLAGLVAADIPLIGAPDFQHRRGEYIDEDGVLKQEQPGYVVCETVDLKMTSRISDHVSRGRIVYRGYAKTTEAILRHPQTLGYGVFSADLYLDLTHVRLGHVYGQRKNGYAGAKRTGLLTVDEVRARWRDTVEPLSREMEEIARLERPEDVPKNFASCEAFGKPCPHAAYCDRSQSTVYDLLQIKGVSMSNGLFDTLVKPEINGVAPSGMPAGLFAPQVAAVPAVPAVPPLTEADRAALVAAEKARLLAPIGCGAPGCGANCTPGWVLLESGAHTQCRACGGTGRGVGALNPPDAVPYDFASSAVALPPEVVATITDPEIIQQVEAHAAAMRAAEPPSVPGQEKTTGRCAGGGVRVQLSQEQAGKKRYFCPTCGKELKIKPSADFKEATLPGHLMTPKEAPSSSKEVAPPLVPTAAPPPVPVYVAPGALPGQTAMPEVVAPPPVPSAPLFPVAGQEMDQLRADNARLRGLLAEVARVVAGA